MKFLQQYVFIQSYLELFYGRNPELAMSAYAEQMYALVRDGFSGNHVIAPYLNSLFFDAYLSIPNCLPAQLMWLRERGGRLERRDDWFYEIARKQVDYYRPDILYLTHSAAMDSRFIRSLVKRPELVVGWWGGPFVPSGTDFSEFDFILSNSPSFHKIAAGFGARETREFFPGFPEYMEWDSCQAKAEYDIVFSGSLGGYHRARLSYLLKLAQIVELRDTELSLALFLNVADKTRLPAALASRDLGPRWGVEMHKALNLGKIVINIDGDNDEDEAGNMRLFEATGTGVFLLTEHHKGIEKYFLPGIEIETFKNFDEMLAKIDFYLAHPEERQKIANRGKLRCHKDYAMKKRAQAFIETITRENY